MTIEELADYLGKDVAILLADEPFRHWAFNRTVETDLENPVIDYVFLNGGMDVVCDSRDKVASIFLYSNESRKFKQDIGNLPFSCGRLEIIARHGSPSKRGDKIKDPILGEHGAWDRFMRSGYAIHVEYQLDVDAIKMITLMRADVVP